MTLKGRNMSLATGSIRVQKEHCGIIVCIVETGKAPCRIQRRSISFAGALHQQTVWTTDRDRRKLRYRTVYSPVLSTYCIVHTDMLSVSDMQAFSLS